MCLQILVPCNAERIGVTAKSCDDLGELSWQAVAMQRPVSGKQKEKQILACGRKVRKSVWVEIWLVRKSVV